jgi:WhiB family redox-sensing transcriptional regulator
VTGGWQARAACAQLVALGWEPETWTETDDPRGAAGQVCRHCPVREDCLAAALAEEAGRGRRSRHGIRGGLGPAARYRLSAPAPRPGGPALCGTYAAYRRHQDRHEEPCEPCQAARAAYMHAYRARRAGNRAA